jgi:hypothetical protein
MSSFRLASSIRGTLLTLKFFGDPGESLLSFIPNVSVVSTSVESNVRLLNDLRLLRIEREEAGREIEGLFGTPLIT